jgi:hypothetical protein
MAVLSAATKPDGDGRCYVLYFHADHDADVWHRFPGKPTYCLTAKQVMWKVRAELAARGVTEDGWIPD